MLAQDLAIIAPEIALAIFAMVGLLGGVYTRKDALTAPLIWLTSFVFLLVAAWLAMKGGITQEAFNGMFIDDSFSRFAKIVILVASAAVLLLSQDYLAKAGLMKFEYPVLISLAVVGMMMMVSSGDLIALYMGLELQSLSLYVIASMRRDSLRSTEAGLKYFVLGALSSGMLLYGASLTYGYAGTTAFAGIAEAAHHGDLSLGLLFGLVFIIAGLAFKVSAAPFHMWTPDVYEGAPTPVTALFATAPKVAAMALFARVMHDAFTHVVSDWQQIVMLLSVVSMFLGAIAAIGQQDIKRLLAYSSIAHMGFALMGLAAGTEAGVEATLIYMSIYVVMNLGTFAFVLSMTRGGEEITDIASLRMLSKAKPFQAFCLLLLMFSLAGIPPLMGFFAKYAVLTAAVEAGLIWLAVLGVIASVVGAYYYLRIVFFMYFGEEEEGIDGNMSAIQTALMTVCAFAMVIGLLSSDIFGLETFAGLAAAALLQ